MSKRYLMCTHKKVRAALSLQIAVEGGKREVGFEGGALRPQFLGGVLMHEAIAGLTFGAKSMDSFFTLQLFSLAHAL